jgi:hypothetical protein
MHVGRGDMASKTEAMFFPKARQSYEEGDTSRFRSLLFGEYNQVKSSGT